MEIFKYDILDTISILKFLYRKKVPIALACTTAVILAIIGTSLIPPKFLATGIVYATASNSSEEILSNPQFGFEVHADRLMQVLSSEVLRDSIIQEFNLIEYYEIDTNRLDWKYSLDRQYTSDISFTRTPYLSVVINARMKDPHLAANVVNRIIDLVDGIRGTIFKQNSFIALQEIEREYLTQKSKVDTLVAEIAQLKEIYKGSNTARLREIQQKNAKFYANEMVDIRLEHAMNQYEYAQHLLNKAQERYNKASAQYERSLPSVYVIDRAKPYFKKVSPSYSRNIILALFLSFLFSILMLWLADSYQYLQKELSRS